MCYGAYMLHELSILLPPSYPISFYVMKDLHRGGVPPEQHLPDASSDDDSKNKYDLEGPRNDANGQRWNSQRRSSHEWDTDGKEGKGTKVKGRRGGNHRLGVEGTHMAANMNMKPRRVCVAWMRAREMSLAGMNDGVRWTTVDLVEVER
jgi:hypothetical protein